MTKQVVYILIIIACIITVGFMPRNCRPLTTGNYKMIITYPYVRMDSVSLNLSDSSFTSYHGKTDSCKGSLFWIDKCYLKMEYNTCGVILQTNELAVLLKKSFGEPVYELSQKKGDTTFFRLTYTGNLHITSAEGYFLKVP